MAKHLEGKVAVVTGGGRGIGRGMCIELARQGAKVIVNDLGGHFDGTGASNEPADEVVNEIKAGGGDAAAVYESVASMAGGERIVQAALDNFGRLDAMVHAAGILRDRMIFNMTEEEWDAVMAVHLKGMFAVGKPSAIIFRQQRSGTLIGFSSTSGLVGNAGQGNYGAAKDGIAGFIRTAARDLGKYGVTCNVIAPSADTRMVQSVSNEARAKRAQAGIASAGGGLAQQRDPAAIAPLVAYLCTDHARDINGQTFFIQDGEISLMNNPYASKTMEKPSGRWTAQEIALLYPNTIGREIANPAPAQPPKA